ncbi:class I SAM-dependent methyltransferase [Paenibacillus alba]|uniref:Class I SAM-dependent methyltransferase n=1 Tax=Paenibacillus alba TaxID=1197127 RepID=A0ABU6GII0_9BACL|nr:class I SAM-dependent methyltransferase [Paenibacillus alba]MEC0232528.1 class I SAM-dependent methyltransferase [Paenibacillus alba]
MTSCPICEAAESKMYHRYPSFNLMKCSGCEVIYRESLESVQQDQLIMDIYDEKWVAMRDQYAVNTLREHASFNTMLLDMFVQKKGKLLEIGSGTGEFLWLAREAGWEVTGVEPSAVACEYANERYSLALHNEIWHEFIFEQGESFDAIVFWHVLEHIPNPKSFMKQVKCLLNPEGRVLFSLPNLHSLTNAILGTASPILVEEDHLCHYAKEHIEQLMDLSGYEIISLFSREEPARLERDLRLNPAVQGYLTNMRETEKIKMMIGLQAGWHGHEIFGIVGHRHE